MVPLLTFLVTPVLLLLLQVKMSAVKRHTYALSQAHYRCLPLKNIGTSDIGRDVIMDSIASLAKMHPSMSVFDW